MKKTLLSITFAALAAMTAAAQNQPAALFGTLMGGVGGDQSTAIAIDKEGNGVWLSTAASTEAAPEIYYGSEKIFSGALYNVGNSGNNNLSLLCTKSDGSLKWSMYSDSGDYMSGQGNVAVDSDGNIVFTAKVRHTDGMLDKPMNLVDATGQKYEFGGTVDQRYYCLLIAKANADGKLLWVKLVDVDTAPAPAASGKNADFTADAIQSQALAIDDDNNIYVGGNYSADITIDGVTLHPVNVSSWTGDSQKGSGNIFLIKLSGEGSYLTSAVGVGDIDGKSIMQSMEWSDGYLYVSGYANGSGTFSFGGVSMSVSADPGLVIGRLDSSLSADWLKCCPGEKVNGTSALQNIGLSVYGDNLWLCGQFNQKIADADDASRSVASVDKSPREGFIIKFDKNSGDWMASANSRAGFPEITKLTGYFKAIQNPDDLGKVYVYGYVMDAAMGVFLRGYDAATLAPVADGSWNLVTGGGVPTAIALAYDPAEGIAYLTARGNKAFSLMGGIDTDATKGWDVLMACFSLPESLSSGVEASVADMLPTSDDVYDLCGRKVGSICSMDRLAPGIYIANHKKFIVR